VNIWSGIMLLTTNELQAGEMFRYQGTSNRHSILPIVYVGDYYTLFKHICLSKKKPSPVSSFTYTWSHRIGRKYGRFIVMMPIINMIRFLYQWTTSYTLGVIWQYLTLLLCYCKLYCVACTIVLLCAVNISMPMITLHCLSCNSINLIHLQIICNYLFDKELG
jgi:hypothetical protein